MEKLVIIDYGAGNLLSARKAVQNAAKESSKEINVICSADYKDVQQADRIILPGVGSFVDCIDNLQNNTPLYEEMVNTVITNKKPFLGICVGMQLMASFGFEFAKKCGLNWIEGEVVKIHPSSSRTKIPHMGWNSLHITNDSHSLTQDLPENKYVYFVHSYHFIPSHSKHVLAHCHYDQTIAAIVAKDNMVGFQFHPEKSQSFGQKLLLRFLQWHP